MNVFANISLPKILYESTSEYNGKIQVIQHGTTRRLMANGFVQSINDDSKSAQARYWGVLVDVLKEQCPDLSKVLILGLGGATVQHMIAKNYPMAHIVSVDIDPEMVKIGKDYFGIDSIPNHTIVNADALRVLSDPSSFGLSKESFDVAIVDIFGGGNYPDLGKSGSFIVALREMIVPEGLVVLNRIYTEDQQYDVNAFVENLKEHFRDVQVKTVAGHTNSDNLIIYGRV